MKTAVITGASSGIGRAFAKKIALSGEAEELWVIARRADRLSALADKLNIPVRRFMLDLGQPSSIEELKRLLREHKPDVRYLVNAAGFGKIGNYNDLTREEIHGMLDVNVRALVDVTLAVLPYMSRGSRLFELSSSSAFQPLPGFNVYAASKAFVLSYTRSLRWELRGRGIHVTAVCPGWTRTEFMDIAVDTKNADPVKHFPLKVSPAFVAGCALLGNRLGLAVVTCGPHTFLHRLTAKLAPNWLIMGIWHLLR